MERFGQTPEGKRLIQDIKYDPVLMGNVCFPSVFKLNSAEFHREICDAYLDRTHNKHVFIAPRGHAKSTILAGIIPLHHIMYDEGQKTILLISKTQSHAIRLLNDIKFLLDNFPDFNALYGDWGTHTFIRDTRHEVVLKDGTTIICAGTGQHIRGLKKDFQRPTLIIFDDPEDENNTKTAEAMEANLNYLLKGMVHALDRKRGRVLVIGTPLHERCMVYTLRDMPDWNALHYSAEADPENEVALWPEHMSWEELMEEKANYEANSRLSVYYQELCCKIIADEQRLFRPEYINYYEGGLEWRGKYPFLNVQQVNRYGEKIGEKQRVPVAIYTGIDPATSTSSTADWFVIFHIAIDHRGRYFILPYVRDRLPPSQAIDRIVAEYKKFKSRRVSIETSGQQETFRDILRMRDDVHIPGLSRKHNPSDKKEKRHLELLEPALRDGKVYFRRGMKELIDEMMMHPKGRHDDLLDGMYYAFLHARQPYHNDTKLNKRLEQQDTSQIENQWQLA